MCTGQLYCDPAFLDFLDKSVLKSYAWMEVLVWMIPCWGGVSGGGVFKGNFKVTDLQTLPEADSGTILSLQNNAPLVPLSGGANQKSHF